MNKMTDCKVPDEIGITAEELRETGKSMLISDDSKTRSEGIKQIVSAHNLGDAESTFIIAKLVLQGNLRPASKDPEKYALKLFCDAANSGCIQARAFLNSYCEKRYMETMESEVPKPGPLVDFEGNRIKINRKGIRTPVDAVLEYMDGINQLTLRTNIFFWGTYFLADQQRFEKAVLDGIKMWQGDYLVFNNQPLKVVMEITKEPRLVDNVLVIPLIDDIGNNVKAMADFFRNSENLGKTKALIDSKRSFASNGIKWTSKSKKIIFIQSENGEFDDYEEIKHVAKHEFGHALGLGDLYESKSDGLEGVQKETYRELDGFYISDKFYNLVMCDHHGPISNNDIEMVLLAFRDNQAQLYQPGNYKEKGVISKALGRGN
ncbi:MAG: hypothetical protein K5761_07690 [Clostridiales bacterium]|nr:hypothetical protein [Clostridiales bacterium]